MWNKLLLDNSLIKHVPSATKTHPFYVDNEFPWIPETELFMKVISIPATWQI
jgi:hypothetical protein